MLPILALKDTLRQHLPGKQAIAPLAQLAEQVTLNHWVAGSIPARCKLFNILGCKCLRWTKLTAACRKLSELGQFLATYPEHPRHPSVVGSPS
jgi:hypothetical protein